EQSRTQPCSAEEAAAGSPLLPLPFAGLAASQAQTQGVAKRFGIVGLRPQSGRCRSDRVGRLARLLVAGHSEGGLPHSSLPPSLTAVRSPERLARIDQLKNAVAGRDVALAGPPRRHPRAPSGEGGCHVAGCGALVAHILHQLERFKALGRELAEHDICEIGNATDEDVGLLPRPRYLEQYFLLFPCHHFPFCLRFFVVGLSASVSPINSSTVILS